MDTWIHAYEWLSPFAAHMKLSQHCYLAILQYKIKSLKQIKTRMPTLWGHDSGLPGARWWTATSCHTFCSSFPPGSSNDWLKSRGGGTRTWSLWLVSGFLYRAPFSRGHPPGFLRPLLQSQIPLPSQVILCTTVWRLSLPASAPSHPQLFS